MKIKTENKTFLIPIDNGVCSFVSNYTDEFVSCMNSYFVNKKKNKCIILDSEDDLIKFDDVAFIYIPSYEDLKQLFELKTKTLVNNELSTFIESNQEMFISIEKMREQLIDFLTDSGMYKFKKIMQQNIGSKIEFILDDFDVSRIIQSISIDTENLTLQQKYMALYNLLLYINRNKNCILYLDFELDEETVLWINQIKNDNILLLIKNEIITLKNKDFIDYVLVVTNNDSIKKVDINKNKVDDLIYCFHPFILKNIEYQIEKIQYLIRNFFFEDTSFLIKFADNITQ